MPATVEYNAPVATIPVPDMLPGQVGEIVSCSVCSAIGRVVVKGRYKGAVAIGADEFYDCPETRVRLLQPGDKVVIG